MNTARANERKNERSYERTKERTRLAQNIVKDKSQGYAIIGRFVLASTMLTYRSFHMYVSIYVYIYLCRTYLLTYVNICMYVSSYVLTYVLSYVERLYEGTKIVRENYAGLWLTLLLLLRLRLGRVTEKPVSPRPHNDRNSFP